MLVSAVAAAAACLPPSCVVGLVGRAGGLAWPCTAPMLACLHKVGAGGDQVTTAPCTALAGRRERSRPCWLPLWVTVSPPGEGRRSPLQAKLMRHHWSDSRGKQHRMSGH